VHANTPIPAPRRDPWERLIRYTARGSVSLERLGKDESGDLITTFSRPWSEGASVSNSRRWSSWRSSPRRCRHRACTR
jgi:hypothetical protein